MDTPDDAARSPAPDHPGRWTWQVLLKKLAIWGLFLAVVYLARDFFFMAFMAFVFCYLTLAVVGWAMARLSPGRERPALRRLLTVAVFVVVPVVLLGAGAVAGPRMAGQAQRLAAWSSQVTPEGEVARVLEGIVGPREFAQEYGGPGDPRYQEGLKEFRASGAQHVAAYHVFPHLEAWVEAGFGKQFLEAERGRIAVKLAREGTSGPAFADWFLKEKVPELQAQARKDVPDKGRPSVPVTPLVRAAASAKPEQLLDQVRHDPAVLATLRQEWLNDTREHAVAAAKGSPAYQEQFRRYYERAHAQAPAALPYTYDQYLELQKARGQGQRAFGETLEKLIPTPEGESEARLRADFESARSHELFQQWWATSSVARFLRNQLDSRMTGDNAARLERFATSLINVPLDLTTALLISLFICIDFPNLKRGVGGVRDTWLRDVHDELAPALHDLTQLIGRALRAQGLIALCNAALLFVALTLLGVEHALLLAGAVAVLCLVPTLGLVLAWVLIVLVALVQPGGGLVLAAEASGAVVLVILIETFVLSPRILGKMMELHPVLTLCILPVAQYFFGVWGLILATPVAVYVIYVVILRKGLPGTQASREGLPAKTPVGPGDEGAAGAPLKGALPAKALDA
jgi:predicted PurR-regulated permease PerM